MSKKKSPIAHQLVFILMAFVVFPVFGQSISGRKPFSIGEQVQFHSAILEQDRILNVYLPASYHEDSTRNYPVIYLLDGSEDEDFIHIAGLVQFGSFSWISVVPESIVVGIQNIDRKHDFTWPTNNAQDKTDFPTTGGSAAFIRTIADEIQPLVRTEYRCTNECMLIGQSLGGLLATEILLKRPELFNTYMIVSPSLWWDNESLLNAVVPSGVQQTEVYIAVGKEGDVMERVARTLHTKLLNSSSRPARTEFSFFPEHDHGDVLHQAIYDGFKKFSLPPETPEGN